MRLVFSTPQVLFTVDLLGDERYERHAAAVTSHNTHHFPLAGFSLHSPRAPPEGLGAGLGMNSGGMTGPRGMGTGLGGMTSMGGVGGHTVGSSVMGMTAGGRRAVERIDRVRLLAARLTRDLLTDRPAVTADRTGALMLRALRRFLNHCSTPPEVQAVSVKETAGRTVPDVVSSTQLSPRPSVGSTQLVPRVSVGSAQLPQRLSVCSTVRTAGTTTGSTSLAPKAVAGAGVGIEARLTRYGVDSLVAIMSELLPLPRAMAARACADHAPTAGKCCIFSAFYVHGPG